MQKCISNICASILTMLGIDIPGDIDSPNPEIEKICPKADRVVLYNPDAVAWWLFEKYPAFFDSAKEKSANAFKISSVMPSVTPVCFASMYTGLMPEKHGITKYEKPVLTVDTLFDYLIAAGKKVAIVSTAGDSISKIFLNRKMDYFIYGSKRKVNKKAEKLIKADKYDVLVIYNPDYDSTMHKCGPEHKKSLKVLRSNLSTYEKFIDIIKNKYTDKKVFFGFCPDHGCHEIDGGRGSHGLDMPEDMNVIHFYGVNF